MDVGAEEESGAGGGGVDEDVPKHARSLRRAEITGSTGNKGCGEIVSDCDGEEGYFWAWGSAD